MQGDFFAHTHALPALDGPVMTGCLLLSHCILQIWPYTAHSACELTFAFFKGDFLLVLALLWKAPKQENPPPGQDFFSLGSGKQQNIVDKNASFLSKAPSKQSKK